MKSIIFDNLAIEENIRKILKEKNLTIKDLSKIMGKIRTLYTRTLGGCKKVIKRI